MDKVLLEYRLNQFITLKLIDFGDNIATTQVYVSGRNFNATIFSLEEAHELLHGNNTYSCMDDVHRSLTGNIRSKFSKVNTETKFWIHCYYIKAWIDHDYDTRLLQMDEAFPILNELYKADEPKAREIFKSEISKRFLSGYFPVISYIICMGYLQFFKFEEILLLLEKCLKIVGFRNFSALKAQFFRFLRDTGFNYFYNGRFNKSINYLMNALKINPSDVETIKQLGIAYLKKGNYNVARTFLLYVLDSPNSDDIFTKTYIREAWCNLGELYNRLLLFNEAIIACRMAMDIDQEHINTWDQIAIAYDRLGEFKFANEAIKHFKKKEKKIKKAMRKEGAQW